MCVPLGSGKALPEWLLTNKQILAEGLKQFQNRGVWCASDPAELSRDLAIQHLLHPSMAEDLIVCLEHLFSIYHLHGYPSRLTRRWAKPKRESLDALYDLIMDNDGGEPCLKLLEFRSTMRYLRLDYHPQLNDFFLGLQKACADEEASDDEYDTDEMDDDHIWYFYPDDAPDLNDVIHDDYPLTGLDEDLFDLSYLAPPVELCGNIQQFHVQARFSKPNDFPPLAAQDLMYGGLSELADAIFPNDEMTTGRVLNTDGTGSRYAGERWEFRRGPFRRSREHERGGVWLLRKRDGCELEYFPDCLRRLPRPVSRKIVRMHSTNIRPPRSESASASNSATVIATTTALADRPRREHFSTAWPSSTASGSSSSSNEAQSTPRSRLGLRDCQRYASLKYR